MSLIKCPECKNEVSEKATSCPKCGCPIQHKFLGVLGALTPTNLFSVEGVKLISFAFLLIIFLLLFAILCGH